jgi:tol-pal system protein YbgF
MQRIVVLKSFIELSPRRMRGRAGKLPSLLLIGSLLTGGLAWSAPPSPPPLVQQARPDNQLMLELLNRIERLEEEIRQLRGDLDLYRHHQEKLMRRVQALEKGGVGASNTETPSVTESAPEPTARESQSLELEAPSPAVVTPPAAAPSLPPGAATPPVTKVQPPIAAPSTAGQSSVLTPNPPTGTEMSTSEQDAYKAAFDALHEGRYDEAVNRFQDFLSSYPTSRLAGDAQYWLGETYYVVRDFDNSKQAFLALGMNYPNSKRLPDAMLKLGYIYDDSGDKAKAREVLQKLTESYPNSRAATLARQRLQAMR